MVGLKAVELSSVKNVYRPHFYISDVKMKRYSSKFHIMCFIGIINGIFMSTNPTKFFIHNDKSNNGFGPCSFEQIRISVQSLKL